MRGTRGNEPVPGSSTFSARPVRVVQRLKSSARCLAPTLPAIDVIVGILAVAGLADCAYFLLVQHRLVDPSARWMPAFCRMDPATCARVLDTPHARLLGIPNAYYGAAWYAGVLFLLGSDAGPTTVPCLAFLVPATLAATYSGYLAAALLWRLRVVCTLCYGAHVVNWALLILLGVRCATHPA